VALLAWQQLRLSTPQAAPAPKGVRRG